MLLRQFLIPLICWIASTPLAATDSGHVIRVLSYNIRYATARDGADAWPHRAEAVSDVIRQHDLVGLQEVTYGQLQELREALPGFEVYSVGRDDGKLAGEHASIFYRDSRFERLDEGTFWLSESPEVAGSKGWDAAVTRICSWVKLRERQSGQEFLFANTHFDHRGQQARARSGELIRDQLIDRSATQPLILTGDFNCLPDSAPYLAIINDGDGPLRDARSISQSAPAGPDSTWSGFSRIVPGRIIDHIFVAGAEVRSIEILNPQTDQGRFASDHLPVQAVIALPQQPVE